MEQNISTHMSTFIENKLEGSRPKCKPLASSLANEIIIDFYFHRFALTIKNMFTAEY